MPPHRVPLILLAAPSLAWAVLILVLLLWPGDSMPSLTFWTLGIPFDLVVHGSLFFIQTILAYPPVLAFMLRSRPHVVVIDRRDVGGMTRTTSPFPMGITVRAWIAAAASASLYGMLTEGLQAVSGIERSASSVDAIADACGALLAAVLLVLPVPKALTRWIRRASNPVRD